MCPDCQKLTAWTHLACQKRPLGHVWPVFRWVRSPLHINLLSTTRYLPKSCSNNSVVFVLSLPCTALYRRHSIRFFRASRCGFSKMFPSQATRLPTTLRCRNPPLVSISWSLVRTRDWSRPAGLTPLRRFWTD